jgi:hypothetical protein
MAEGATNIFEDWWKLRNVGLPLSMLNSRKAIYALGRTHGA